MPRLIDADAMLQKLSRMIAYCGKDKEVNGLTALFQVGDAIMDCPTVDAVPVVRCKDCQWYAPNNDGSWCGCAIDTSHPDNEPKPDDFCSFGERRTDDG